MAATLLDFLMILSLGLLAGTGAGLFIGFIAGRQGKWDVMSEKDVLVNIILCLLFSAAIAAVLAWYIFLYSSAP